MTPAAMKRRELNYLDEFGVGHAINQNVGDFEDARLALVALALCDDFPITRLDVPVPLTIWILAVLETQLLFGGHARIRLNYRRKSIPNPAMTEAEQIVAFESELDALICRYRSDFTMTYASMIGVLQIQVHILITDACDESAEDDDKH